MTLQEQANAAYPESGGLGTYLFQRAAYIAGAESQSKGLREVLQELVVKDNQINTSSKNQNKMEKQELLNAISTLAGSIDPLIRADKKEAIQPIVDKMLKLIEQLA